MLHNFKALNVFSTFIFRLRAFFAVLALLICCASAQNTSAATFTVTRNDDRSATCNSGVDCSLREAVAAASVGFNDDTINFAAGLSLITLTAEIEIVPAGSLTISGASANVLTIDGGAGTNRIFYLNNASVSIFGVTLQGGNGDGAVNSGVGGAIYSSSGQLTLNAVVVRNNSAASTLGGGVALGGGKHRIINSTFSGNSANQCGGIYFFGMNLFIVNSTISGNTTAPGASGDAKGAGFCNGGAATIRNSTITNNSSTGAASKGGGVYNFQGTLNIGNTIIAGNSAQDYSEIQNDDTINSAGNNLIGDSANDSTDTRIAITYQLSDILDTPPQLGALTIANGGATPTHALLGGSPAIDKGSNALAVDPFNNSALAIDQRGLTRIVDGNADGTATVDIGAYELQIAPTAADVMVSGRVLTTDGRGIKNVLVTMINSNGESRTAISSQFGYFKFDNVAAGGTYIFSVHAKRYTFSQPTLVRSIVEDADDLVFTANNQ